MYTKSHAVLRMVASLNLDRDEQTSQLTEINSCYGSDGYEGSGFAGIKSTTCQDHLQ